MSHFHSAPSISHFASSVRSAKFTGVANPLRRSSGLLFVVLLHLAAIVAIKNGLVVSIALPNIPPVHVLPTFDPPKPPPIPIDPIKPKTPVTSTLAKEMPQAPVTNTEPKENPKSDPVVIKGDAKNAEATNQNTEPEIVMARVDPAHPLTQPNYPAASRRANEQGRVELILYILANGKVGEARIVQSSGYTRLDDSAVREALRSWRFIPQQEKGISVPSWQRFAITFRFER